MGRRRSSDHRWDTQDYEKNERMKHGEWMLVWFRQGRWCYRRDGSVAEEYSRNLGRPNVRGGLFFRVDINSVSHSWSPIAVMINRKVGKEYSNVSENYCFRRKFPSECENRKQPNINNVLRGRNGNSRLVRDAYLQNCRLQKVQISVRFIGQSK